MIASQRLVPQLAPLQDPAPSVFPEISPSVVPGGSAPPADAGATAAAANAEARVVIVMAAVVAGTAMASFLFFVVRRLIRIISDLDTLQLGPKLEATTTTLPDAEPEQMQRRLSEQMTVALEDLEKGDDPRRAIIAC